MLRNLLGINDAHATHLYYYTPKDMIMPVSGKWTAFEGKMPRKGM